MHLLAIFTIFNGVIAHTKIYKVVNSVDCLFPNQIGQNPMEAAEKLEKIDMQCGSGAKPARKQCKVNAGSEIILKYDVDTSHNQAEGPIIAKSHVGPCNAYLAPSGGAGSKAPTEGWFKIYQGIWDPQNKWCTDKLRNDDGILKIPIPSGIKAGNYILRSEVTSVHKPEAQFYVQCLDLAISSNGTALPLSKETVSIPGYLSMKSPGVKFNAYSKFGGSKYPSLGPSVWKSPATTNPRNKTSRYRCRRKNSK